MTKNDVKELIKGIKNKLQIRKYYYVTIIDIEKGGCCTDILKLSKNERKIRIDEINNDPELRIVNHYDNGIVAIM